MLVIRLSRTGRKKQPNYRVVVAEKSAAVKGRFLEILGHYNPRTKDLQLDADRAKAVLADGAQPSDTAEALLQKAGVLKREPITEKNRRPTRQKRKQAEAETAAPAAEATPKQGDDTSATTEAPAAETDQADAPSADVKTEVKSETVESAEDADAKEQPADSPQDEPKAAEGADAVVDKTTVENKTTTEDTTNEKPDEEGA